MDPRDMQDDAETHFVVGALVAAVGAASYFAEAYMGALSIAGLLLVLRGVRLKRAERQPQGLGGWVEEAGEFERLAGDLWHRLDERHTTLGPPLDWPNALTSLVRSACWPGETPRNRDAEISTTRLRELTRRIYAVDGRSLFDGPDGYWPFDKQIRHPMAQLVRRWSERVDGSDGDDLRRELRDRLGLGHLPTVKLLWWVEEAKAEHIQYVAPVFTSYRVLRGVLEEAAPTGDARRELVARLEEGDAIGRSVRESGYDWDSLLRAETRFIQWVDSVVGCLREHGLGQYVDGFGGFMEPSEITGLTQEALIKRIESRTRSLGGIIDPAGPTTRVTAAPSRLGIGEGDDHPFDAGDP